MTSDKKEITSALTHLGGAIFGLIGLILLVRMAVKSSSLLALASFLIFGLSMIFLYSTSCAYHFIDSSKKG